MTPEEQKQLTQQERLEQEHLPDLTPRQQFEELAEHQRNLLRKRGIHGSSSDLYIAKNADVAIIGIQTSQYGHGHDSIYVFKSSQNGPTVDILLDEHSILGRVFPTGISAEGERFFYRKITEKGKRNDLEADIQ
ncbi:hypothetical protein J4219_01895 [Candidatus Woesearchaeota archaeon]|nr:hypothetical protein [Candidatus Woesearchaeota archaeon]